MSGASEAWDAGGGGGEQAVVPRRAFSLIELVVVIVIIGVIGAVAVPRFSRGADGAAEAVMADDLATLHRAAELFATEHDGQYPSATNVTNLLLLHSDEQGHSSTTLSPPYIYGPYLRKIPPLPMGPHKGDQGISTIAATGVAWIYSDLDGGFKPNMTP